MTEDMSETVTQEDSKASLSKVRWRKKHVRQKLLIVLMTGVIGIILLFVYSLTMGIYSIEFGEAMSCLWNIICNFGPDMDSMPEKVIYILRMPRSVCVLCVGAGLAVAGCVMQALIKNPLVDPYITGVSSGAAFAVVLVSMTEVTLGIMAALVVPVAAMIGAIAAFALTMAVAEVAGGKAMSYVLAGVIISTGLSAANTLIIYFNANDYVGILKWMFGSFADLTWDNAYVIAAGTIIPILVAFLFSKRLNILLLGEEQAQYLGIDVRKTKRVMMILIAILAAFCVAYCGVIGFIGLIIPHVCRMIFGGDHRLLIPCSAIVGALVMLIADIACKTLAAPSELPIGAIVAVIGVPFFLFLMVKEGRRYVM